MNAKADDVLYEEKLEVNQLREELTNRASRIATSLDQK